MPHLRNEWGRDLEISFQVARASALVSTAVGWYEPIQKSPWRTRSPAMLTAVHYRLLSIPLHQVHPTLLSGLLLCAALVYDIGDLVRRTSSTTKSCRLLRVSQAKPKVSDYLPLAQALYNRAMFCVISRRSGRGEQ